jgi:hypothetical protein
MIDVQINIFMVYKLRGIEAKLRVSVRLAHYKATILKYSVIFVGHLGIL